LWTKRNLFSILSYKSDVIVLTYELYPLREIYRDDHDVDDE